MSEQLLVGAALIVDVLVNVDDAGERLRLLGRLVAGTAGESGHPEAT
jgi:hypothetical protein